MKRFLKKICDSFSSKETDSTIDEEGYYLVLSRETIKKVLTQDEIDALNEIIDKVDNFEGYKEYEVIEIE